MDPEAMAKAGEVPGELNSLDINNLLVKIVGAQLSGNGGFTFDNTDMVTFNGMPKPTGAVNLNLSGANALIDKLVNMGLLPQEQAMGARMMMGLFTVPQGDDVLSSKIEINEQGHILANGQRIQ
jgi:PPE-repeat protein